MLRAVATDGHRLARVEMPLPEGAADMPGVIVPRKTVGEVRKLIEETSTATSRSRCPTPASVRVSIDVVLTSKLIDGTFPDYRTGHPAPATTRCWKWNARSFADAVGPRVDHLSRKSRPVKLSLARDLLTLSAASPESGQRPRKELDT